MEDYGASWSLFNCKSIGGELVIGWNNKIKTILTFHIRAIKMTTSIFSLCTIIPIHREHLFEIFYKSFRNLESFEEMCTRCNKLKYTHFKVVLVMKWLITFQHIHRNFILEFKVKLAKNISCVTATLDMTTKTYATESVKTIYVVQLKYYLNWKIHKSTQ